MVHVLALAALTPLAHAAAPAYHDPDARPKVLRTRDTGKGFGGVESALLKGFANKPGVDVGHCWTLRSSHPVDRPRPMTLSMKLTRLGESKGVRLLKGTGFDDVDECVVDTLKWNFGFGHSPYPERVEFDLQLPRRPTPDDSPLPGPDYITHGTLENGLQYWVRAVPRARTTIELAVGVGSAMEKPEQAGFAHLLEHMAFRGTRRFESAELMANVYTRSWKSTHSNASTSMDQTVFSIAVPAGEDWNTALDITRDWAAAELTFDEESFDPERRVVIEEWRRHVVA